jgi:hypothetical protein
MRKCWLVFLPTVLMAAGPPTGAVSAFEAYARMVESRIGVGVVGPEVAIERIGAPEVSGALLHDWRGTAFAPGATVAGFEKLLRDFDGYPKYFAPQVVEVRVLSGTGDHFEVRMRVRQKHVITVVLDTTYAVTFGRGSSVSKSTRIEEVGGDHGFLWRLNTYWNYAERNGGLALQMESVSLTRAVPRGLGWVVGPYVESIPRESLEFTLRSVLRVLKGAK